MGSVAMAVTVTVAEAVTLMLTVVLYSNSSVIVSQVKDVFLNNTVTHTCTICNFYEDSDIIFSPRIISPIKYFCI